MTRNAGEVEVGVTGVGTGLTIRRVEGCWYGAGRARALRNVLINFEGGLGAVPRGRIGTDERIEWGERVGRDPERGLVPPVKPPSVNG